MSYILIINKQVPILMVMVDTAPTDVAGMGRVTNLLLAAGKSLELPRDGYSQKMRASESRNQRKVVQMW